MNDEQKAICHKIADHYGEHHQMLKAVEEMAELIQVIVKDMGYSADPVPNREYYIEELADVAIMIEQLVYACNSNFNGSISLREAISYKLERQLRRMEDENDEQT